MKRTVRIFIASSSENLDVPHTLSDILGKSKRKTFRIAPAPWDQGTFKLSDTYIESLEKEMDKADFSILVLTPNDVTRIRDEEVETPRDNVLFELGLFMGRLRRERCFMLYEYDNKPKIPTDLLGVSAATYQKSEPDGLGKALAPACKEILNRVSEILEEQKLSIFVSNIEGGWWQRIETKAGIELSFFNIFPNDKYKSLSMRGDHFNGEGKQIGSWKSMVVGIREDQRELFYQWEGEHPPNKDGDALTVKGFGTLEFDHAKGGSEKGKGRFMDVNPSAMITCQWKTVRLKRAPKSHIRTMNKAGHLADKKALVSQVLCNW